MAALGLLLAEYAGIVVFRIIWEIISVAYGIKEISIIGAFHQAVVLVVFSVALIPFTLAVTWKGALITITLAELLRRNGWFYPLAGAAVGYWSHLSQAHFLFDSNFGYIVPLVVGGSAGGYVFWYIAVRNLDFDMST